MTQIKSTDLSILGAVKSQLENIVKYTVLIALWFELRTHLYAIFVAFYEGFLKILTTQPFGELTKIKQQKVIP